MKTFYWVIFGIAAIVMAVMVLIRMSREPLPTPTPTASNMVVGDGLDEEGVNETDFQQRVDRAFVRLDARIGELEQDRARGGGIANNARR